MKILKYKMTDADCDVTYLKHPDFKSMSDETQSLLIMVQSLLSDAHLIESDSDKDIRILLQKYSPNNRLLDSEKYISWGLGLHNLIADIITGKDISSPSFKPRTKH